MFDDTRGSKGKKNVIYNYFTPIEGTSRSQTKRNVTDEEEPATQSDEEKSELMDVTRPQKRRRKIRK